MYNDIFIELFEMKKKKDFTFYIKIIFLIIKKLQDT